MLLPAWLFMEVAVCCDGEQPMEVYYTLETELPGATIGDLALRLYELEDGSVLVGDVRFHYWDVMRKRWYVGVRSATHGAEIGATLNRLDQALVSLGWNPYP